MKNGIKGLEPNRMNLSDPYIVVAGKKDTSGHWHTTPIVTAPSYGWAVLAVYTHPRCIPISMSPDDPDTAVAVMDASSSQLMPREAMTLCN